MGEISRAALFGKLNSVAYKAIEAATVFCKLRGNPYVELAHWFHQLLQLQDSDLHRIIRQFNVEPARLARDLTEALDRLPRGSTSITDLSSHVEEAVERGWVYGSLMFGESQVRTGYLVLGILKTPSLRRFDVELADDAVQVRVLQLQQLVKPVSQFHIRVAPQFAEHGGGFDGLVGHAVEFAEQCGATDFTHALDSLRWWRGRRPGRR